MWRLAVLAALARGAENGTCAAGGGDGACAAETLADMTVVYFHVLKTGGTTWWMSLAPLLPSKFPQGVNPAASRLHPGCATEIPGHCSFPEVEQCLAKGWPPTAKRLRRPFRFLTILRDPVDRVVSEFYYLMQHRPDLRMHNWPVALRNDNEWGAGRVSPTIEELRTWVRSPYNLAHNRQTKQLVAPVTLTEKRKVCLNRDTQQYSNVWMNATGLPGDEVEAHLNAEPELARWAVAILEQKFMFVGVLERFDESKKRFAEKYGLDPDRIKTDAKLEPSGKPKRSELPEDILAEIEERNKLDRELYNAALRLLDS